MYKVHVNTGNATWFHAAHTSEQDAIAHAQTLARLTRCTIIVMRDRAIITQVHPR